jgi:hypothetical protein
MSGNNYVNIQCFFGSDPLHLGEKVCKRDHVRMPMSPIAAMSPPSPHSPVSWHDCTGSNLSSAKAARNAAEELIQQSSRMHQTTRNGNALNYKNLQTNTSEKVATSKELEAMLAKRMQSVSQHLANSKRSLAQLRQSDQATLEPLQLNLWRQEMRTQRPHRELVRDSFEIALEGEQSALQNTQDTLRQATKNTEEMIWNLGSVFQSLKFDHEHKLESKEVDETCLMAMKNPWPSSPHSARTPSSLRSVGAALTARGAPGAPDPTTPKRLEFTSGGMLTLKAPADPHANAERNT